MTCAYCCRHIHERHVVVHRGLPFCSVRHYETYTKLNGRRLLEPVEQSVMDGETVLVIDDEPLVRMLVVDVLEELGYAALEAGDGPSGLKVLQSKDRVDLLITDVGLPGGLSGRQVADAARALRPELKVLYITGYAEDAALNHGHLEHGMQVVTKPFGVEDLGRKITAMLSGE